MLGNNSERRKAKDLETIEISALFRKPVGPAERTAVHSKDSR